MTEVDAVEVAQNQAAGNGRARRHQPQPELGRTVEGDRWTSCLSH